MLLMIVPYIINCLTHFVSAQIKKLEQAVPVQQEYIKQIISPGWMHETGARAWCTEKTQRDWVEREVGGGIRMGNTCKSMADKTHYDIVKQLASN